MHAHGAPVDPLWTTPGVRAHTRDRPRAISVQLAADKGGHPEHLGLPLYACPRSSSVHNASFQAGRVPGRVSLTGRTTCGQPTVPQAVSRPSETEKRRAPTRSTERRCPWSGGLSVELSQVTNTPPRHVRDHDTLSAAVTAPAPCRFC